MLKEHKADLTVGGGVCVCVVCVCVGEREIDRTCGWRPLFKFNSAAVATYYQAHNDALSRASRLDQIKFHTLPAGRRTFDSSGPGVRGNHLYSFIHPLPAGR